VIALFVFGMSFYALLEEIAARRWIAACLVGLAIVFVSLAMWTARCLDDIRAKLVEFLVLENAIKRLDFDEKQRTTVNER